MAKESVERLYEIAINERWTDMPYLVTFNNNMKGAPMKLKREVARKMNVCLEMYKRKVGKPQAIFNEILSLGRDWKDNTVSYRVYGDNDL